MVKTFISIFFLKSEFCLRLLQRAVVDSSEQLCAFSSVPLHALHLGEPRQTSKALLQLL